MYVCLYACRVVCMRPLKTHFSILEREKCKARKGKGGKDGKQHNFLFYFHTWHKHACVREGKRKFYTPLGGLAFLIIRLRRRLLSDSQCSVIYSIFSLVSFLPILLIVNHSSFFYLDSFFLFSIPNPSFTFLFLF